MLKLLTTKSKTPLYKIKGRRRAFAGELLDDGGVYFAVDVPGVGNGDVEVFANEREINFTAELKNVFEHDESGPLYLGSVDTSWSDSSAASLLSHNIIAAVNFGVLKVLIIPPPNTHNNE
ncbi:Heat shock protein HSP20/alpha crystallin family [Raphanus sativus]|nr:Heat shock protein HSP20/alpha crystallin family [Raphanus sativus]